MKVRIVKCTHYSQWYANQIGSIINVIPHSDGINYAANFVGESHTHFMYAEDCEILEADEPKPEPFDLERALKGEKVVTLDGRTVSEIVEIKSLESPNILVVVEGAHAFVDNKGLCYVRCWSLEMAPREPEYQTVWVNLYSNNSTIKNSGFITGTVSLSKDRSLEISLDNNSNYIGTFPITFKKP